MGDALAARLGVRFLFVTLFPNLYFFGVLGVLLIAGAPGGRPSWTVFEQRIDGVTFQGIALAGVGIVLLSLATHPLQLPLIQIIEGYWLGLPGGATLERLGRRRYEDLLTRARATDASDGVDEATRAEAQRIMRWLPVRQHLRPTELGNALYTGEVRAGERYRLRTDLAWPRLRALLPEPQLGQVNDTRNQLDASVRYCVLSLVAAATTLLILLPYDIWLIVPLALYLFAWGSYRAAVAGAKRFCEELEVAFDLHHLRLWDALALPRPANLREERSRAKRLTRMLAGSDLRKKDYARFVYVDDQAPAAGPAAAAPGPPVSP